MDTTRDIPLAEALEAARDWWRVAGVDQDFTDEPHNWLEVPEPEAPADNQSQVAAPAAIPVEPPKPPLGGNRADWPQSLAGFAEWWLTEPSLAPAGTSRRVRPRGVADADLMVLVATPEEGDGETLLEGPQGFMVGNMLAAMGIAPERAYIASALPLHMKHADWAMLMRREYGAIVQHHISLAAPKRLLILGQEILPLFGHDPAQGSAIPRQIALEGTNTAALAAVGVEALLNERRFRAALWQAWLDWRDDPA